MVDEFDFVVVVLLIIGLTYGFVKQIHHTLTFQKSHKTDSPQYRRTLFGNYLICVSYFGFLSSYILNIFIALQMIQSTMISSENTSFSCFVCILVLLIVKFGVIPKSLKQNVI